MPPDNRFRHQVYHSDPPVAPYRRVRAGEPVDPDSDQYHARLAAVGREMGAANVRAVFCLHGTFAGDDLLGLLMGLARIAPKVQRPLSRFRRALTDRILGEKGNYSKRFAKDFSEAITEGAGRPIPVERFVWSGQNNHIARADGAIKLLLRLADQAQGWVDGSPPGADPRVMLWGHSHGANALALAANLLGADTHSRDRFFEAARCHYQRWIGRGIDVPEWTRARHLLEDPDHPLHRLRIDVATFGIPVRYGWDTAGYANLLHFIHHHPKPGKPEYLARYPIWPHRWFFCCDGDYVQHVGIAGSNFPPLLLGGRTFWANRRLGRMLEEAVRPGWILPRVRKAMRVPEEGATLLVDYGPRRDGPLLYFAGHGLYTHRCWLPWHAERVAEHFYGNIDGPPTEQQREATVSE